MFKYYNEDDERVKKYVENILVFSHKCTNADKARIRDLIKTRRFILDSFNPKYSDVFKGYFGLDGEYFQTQNEIGAKYGVSGERVRQWVNDMITRIATNPTRFKAVCNFNDEYLKLKYNYDCYTLDILKQMVLENDVELEQQQIAVLSVEKQEARILLNKILKLKLRDLNIALPKLNTFKFKDYSSIEELLKIRKEDFSSQEYKDLVDKIHSLGLFFYDEFDYKEDWLNACYNGIISSDIKQVQQKLRIREDVDAISKKFNKIIYTTIEELNLSVRSQNSLLAAGIYTVEDLVKLTEAKCYKIINLGNKSIREIEQKLADLGLEFCPKEIHPSQYIDRLERRYRTNLQQGKEKYNTPKLKHDKETQEFYNLLRTNIEDLGLSVRAFNGLQIAGVTTIEDLVSMTYKDLSTMKRIGRKSIAEIENLVSALDLEFRPEAISEASWQMKLKTRYLQKNRKVVEPPVKMDIYEIPEQYRRVYAIGAMAEAKKEMDSVNIKDRLFSRAIEARINKKQSNIKPTSHTITNLDIIEELRKDPESIIYLDEAFIEQHREELIGIIKASNFEQEKKESLISIIENINTLQR